MLIFFSNSISYFSPCLDIFANAETVVADQGQGFILNCTTSNPNLVITWVQTLNKKGLFVVEEDTRVRFVNNGYDLSFGYIVPADEEYYVCGVYDAEAGTFQTIKSYYLFVRG